MDFFDRSTARVILTALLFAVVLGFLWLARKPLLVFLFASLFAYLLEPMVGWVQPKLHNSRGLAILVIYVLGAIFIALLGVIAGPRIADESQRLARAAPQLYERIASGDIAWQVAARRGWSRETAQSVQRFLAAHRDSVLHVATSLGVRAGSTATNLGWLVLVPILAVFFLKDKTKFSQAAQALIEDSRERNFLRSVLSDLDEMLAHYVRAQLYLAAISGAAYTTALALLLRVPYALVLGTMAGFLEFVPVVGPLVAATVILGVAFATNYAHLLLLLLFLGAWRLVQDYVVAPRVLGGRVKIHPLAAIFGVLVGGQVAGIVGVYLAIPAMATIRILWNAGRQYQQSPELERIDREAA
jgi:predicted PurR-regulated permease PerM